MNKPLKINFASNGILLSLRSKDLCNVVGEQVVEEDETVGFITSFANFLDGSKQSNAPTGALLSLLLLLLSSSDDDDDDE